MTEKKSKSKTRTKRNSRSKATRSKNHALHPADVREEVLEMVEDHAHTMAQAVIQQAEQQGQLATVKYLFEAANILPSPKEDGEASKEEDSLAETLLERLNIPTVPVAKDEEGNVATEPDKVEEASENKDEKPGGE